MKQLRRSRRRVCFVGGGIMRTINNLDNLTTRRGFDCVRELTKEGGEIGLVARWIQPEPEIS
jgi:hypothetical protein